MSVQTVRDRSSIHINFASQQLELLANGCCFWPQKKLLIVADLHLEKGSYFAALGQPLPLSDTKETLLRLQQVIRQLKPTSVICLGDNVHDAKAFIRMNPNDLALLISLCSEVNQWIWILGNHDKIDLKNSPLSNMNFSAGVMIENIFFSHDFDNNALFQMVGHYHPKTTVSKQGIRIAGKCFLLDDRRMILPSFGTYTGGLDASNAVYKKHMTGKMQQYLIYKNQIWHV